MTCRDAVNDCDIPETCTGDSSQVKKKLITRCSKSSISWFFFLIYFNVFFLSVVLVLKKKLYEVNNN